jgi:ABC-type transporter Mla MlaB component
MSSVASATGVILAPAVITMANAGAIARDWVRAVQAGAQTIDLKPVQQADSSALALLLQAMRQLRAASTAHKPLVIQNPPENLRRLAVLYGVHSILFE